MDVVVFFSSVHIFVHDSLDSLPTVTVATYAMIVMSTANMTGPEKGQYFMVPSLSKIALMASDHARAAIRPKALVMSVANSLDMSFPV